jgi:hypothetical protein
MFWANVLLHITGFDLRSSLARNMALIAKNMALLTGILSDILKNKVYFLYLTHT